MTTSTDTSPEKLFPKQSSYSSKHTVFFWVVWVVFAGNFEYRWERIRKAIYLVSYLLGNLESIERQPPLSQSSGRQCERLIKED